MTDNQNDNNHQKGEWERDMEDEREKKLLSSSFPSSLSKEQLTITKGEEELLGLRDGNLSQSKSVLDWVKTKIKIADEDRCCNCSKFHTFSCPKCGNSYCNDHSGSSSCTARLDPITGLAKKDGIWKRICGPCFMDQSKALDDARIISRNPTDQFTLLRQKLINDSQFERESIERRFEKLSDFPGSTKEEWKQWEQEIVSWDKDSTNLSCFYCKISFNPIHRRHHCRLCGRIICSDCSRLVPIKLSVIENVRSCSHCHNLLFNRSRIIQNESEFDQLNGIYLKISHIKEQLTNMIPAYRDKYENGELADSVCLKDTINLNILSLEKLIEQLKILEAQERTTKEIPRKLVLIQNLIRSSKGFLQKQIKFMQIGFKSAIKNGISIHTRDGTGIKRTESKRSGSSQSSSPGMLDRFLPSFFILKHHQTCLEEGEGGERGFYSSSKTTTTTPIPLPSNFGALMQKLEVYHEQRAQISYFIDEAIRGNRFEELRVLKSSFDELENEIDHLKFIINKK